MLVKIGIIVTFCLSLLPYVVNPMIAVRLIVDAGGYKINVTIMA